MQRKPEAAVDAEAATLTEDFATEEVTPAQPSAVTEATGAVEAVAAAADTPAMPPAAADVVASWRTAVAAGALKQQLRKQQQQ
jgi:hypothetical protein